MCYSVKKFLKILHFWFFFNFRRLFLEQHLQRTTQNQRTMPYTCLGIGEYPIVRALWVELIESRLLVEEQFPGYPQIIRAVEHRILLMIK